MPSRRSSTRMPRTAASARCPPTKPSGCCRIPSTATPATRRCVRCPCRPARWSLNCPTHPAKALRWWTSRPLRGDQRLLVGHERRGREELLIWDPTTGAVTELPIDLPGDLDADFYPDGSALLVLHTHAGRTTVHRYDLGSGVLTDLPLAAGVVSGASARPDGSIWYRWSSAAAPGQLRVLRPDGTDGLLHAAGRRTGTGIGTRHATCGWTVRAAGSTPCWPFRRVRRRNRAAGRRCSPCTAARRWATRTPSTPVGRPGWTPVSPSSRSTTAVPPDTDRPGGTRSPSGSGTPNWPTSPLCTTISSPRASSTRPSR